MCITLIITEMTYKLNYSITFEFIALHKAKIIPVLTEISTAIILRVYSEPYLGPWPKNS